MKNKLFYLTIIFLILISSIASAQMQWGDAEPDWIAEAKRKAAENQVKEQAWVKKAYAKNLGIEVEDDEEETNIIVNPAQKSNKEIINIDDEKIEVLLVEE